MLINVLVSLIILKAKTPYLPQLQRISLLGIIASILALIAASFLLLSHVLDDNLNIGIIAQMVFNSIIRVVFPLYYIFNTATLYEYFLHVLEKHVFKPIVRFKARMVQLVDWFMPSPNQIDVIV